MHVDTHNREHVGRLDNWAYARFSLCLFFVMAMTAGGQVTMSGQRALACLGEMSNGPARHSSKPRFLMIANTPLNARLNHGTKLANKGNSRLEQRRRSKPVSLNSVSR